MKRILLVLMLFSSVIILNACGTTTRPEITNPDEDYFTVTEGNYTYTVKNGRIFESLRDQVGYSILMDTIDKDILKNTKVAGVSYWDKVTDEDIENRLMSDAIPSGMDDLSEEEIAERREKHINTMFTRYGLMNEEAVYEYYQLLLAREFYAKDKINEQVAEEDFTDKQYENYFNNNYQDEFYAIIISFDIKLSMINALEQLGYKLVGNEVKFIDGTDLDKNDTIQMFIELFNMINSDKVEDYKSESLVLNEGIEYTVVDGEINFDLEKIDVLHYTSRELRVYESAILRELGEFDNYNEGENFYTSSLKTYKNGARHSLFMKVAEVNYDFDEVKDEIKEKLIDQRLTSSFINTEMIKLRVENNIRLYDPVFKDNFADELESNKIEYDLGKKNDSYMFAETDVNSYNADELFSIMNQSYGISAAISEIEFARFVTNLSINNIYDFINNEVIDEVKWSVITQAIKDEKKNFNDDLYATEGFPKSYGWKNYIKDVYDANSEKELEKLFVFQDVKDSYGKAFGALEGLDENSDLWQFYKSHMEQMEEEYFNVTGIHLLISMRDSSGNPVDPEDWTEDQIELAELFYNQVMDYLNKDDSSESGTKSEILTRRIESIDRAYKRAPYFVPGLPKETESQPQIEGLSYVFEGIELSKFKSAGLQADYENLGSFTNGRMVEEFNNAAKSIWDADSDSTEPVIYGSNKDESGNYEYLVTQFGYHVYVNTKTTPIPTITEDVVLPGIGAAKKYIEDNNDSDFSTKLKSALDTYFRPIYNELTSTSYSQIQSYKSILDLDITVSHDNYKVDDLKRFLGLNIDLMKANLRFAEVE